MAQPTAFDVWSQNQKAKGGSGEFGSAPVYGTTAYIGMDPSLYAGLQSADQPMSPGANASYANVAGTGAALSSMPTMVGGLAYDSDPYAQYRQQVAQQASGGFMASTGNNQAPGGNLTTGLTRDPGMMQPGQVSAGQYGSYNSPSQANQYTQQQANALTANSNQNLQTQLAGIGSNFQGNGSYGSNRQGIAQGTAAGMAQTGLNSTLANLYSGNYQNDVTNSLQQQQLNNSYDLGLGGLGVQYGNLALGNKTADQNYATAQGQLGLGYYNGANSAQNNQNNFYTAQRGQDLQSIALGSSLYGQGVNGNLGLGQGMYNTGNTAYQAPQNALNNYANTVNQFSGLGGSSTTTGQSPSNPLGGAIGGALAGSQLGNLWGNLGTPSPYNNSYLGTNAQGLVGM